MAGMVAAVLLCASASACGSASASHGLRIRTAHGNEAELAAKHQIEAVLARHDVARWIYTRDVLVEQGAIPHSHPVLTLNARPGGDDAKLATFVHEQFHWYVDAHRRAREAAMADFARLFPDAPAGGPQGARDRQSTYLHLIVCDLELQAMTELVGEARAREVLAGSMHYTWIYEQVLGNPAIRRVNARHGLLVPR